MNDVEYLISKFIDGELSTDEEQELFSRLSVNTMDRKTLFNFIKIDKETSEIYRAPSILSSRDLNFVINKSNHSSKSKIFAFTFPILKYVAVILLLIISLFFLIQTQSYSNQLEIALKRINQKTELIEVLKNSIPPVRVTLQSAEKFIVKTNM